jgi:xylulokinase
VVTLGIDVGTSSVKVLGVDEAGGVVGFSSAPYATPRKARGVERDPEAWWAAVCMAVRDCLKQDGVAPSEVAAVGFSGHMSSVVLVDRESQVVRPALLLSDPQGFAELGGVSGELRSRIEAETHNPLNTAFSIAKLLWLKENAPADLDRAAAWFTAKDYVRLLFTGAVATDPTDAYNSLLLDPHTYEWRWDWIDALALPSQLFPPLGESVGVAGGVTGSAAAETGLAEGTPVVTGAADMACAAIGSGTIHEGQLGISLGTSTTVIAPLETSEFAPEWQAKLTYHPLPDPYGQYALASLLTGGLALNWIRSLGDANIGDIESVTPDDSRQLIFLPHLSGSGTPEFDSHMRGTLLGISPQTSMRDIAMALFEAIAFDLRRVMDLLNTGTTDKVRVSGGGANIGPWMQVITDVIGFPVEVVRYKEVSALGAASLAAAGSKAPSESSEAVVGRVQVEETYHPRTEHSAAWEKRFRRYSDALRTSREYYHRWRQ